ncbi:MAG: hypothetical protein AVDCRST_MAG85-780, partial [uncultured Solirubrobacteraceae bacterium]
LAATAPGARSANLPESGTLQLPEGADLTLTGESSALAGAVVNPAGDVNGDQRPDFLVASPGATARGRGTAGSVFVVFGPREGLPEKLTELGGRGIRIDGAAPGDRLGTSAAAAGDVILGAPRADNQPGAAYVILGRREAGAIDLGARGNSEIKLSAGGSSTGDHVGITVASTPDMDGDQRPELLVGADRIGAAEGATPPPPPGAAFVVFAKAATADVDLAKLGEKGIRLDGPAGSSAGLGLGGSPDMNGDGRGEIVVGAPTVGARTSPTATTFPTDAKGAVYVVFGRATGGMIDLNALGNDGFTVAAAPQDGQLGIGSLGVPDLTGDGVADLITGSPGADRNKRVDSGSVHVVAGQKAPGTIDLNAPGRPGFRVDGGASDDGLGRWNDTVSDISGDGRAELLFAAQNADADSKTDAGAGYVIFGAEKPAPEIDLSALRDLGYRIAGATAGGRLGSIAGLGDIDGDNRGDILVGTQGAGTASLILGPKPPAVPPPPPDPGVAEEIASGCKAVTNVQIILDDSLSMRRTDPQNLRRQAIELLITKPRNEGKVIGVYEFGSSGAQVLPAQAIIPRGVAGSNIAAMIDKLEGSILGDNGGTNYNIGFKGAADDNPAAQARIFITDGGHRGSPYLDLHRGGVPTFTVGLGAASNRGVFKSRLDRIAAETKGRSFTGVSVDDVIRVVNSIDSGLNCDVDIDTDEDTLTLEDPVDEQVVPLVVNARTCDVEVNWGDQDENVEPEEIAFISEGRIVGRASGKRLRSVVRRPGRTFSIGGVRVKGQKRGGRFGLRLSGMPASKLRIRYKVTKVDGKAAKVTSQITQSRRRQIEQGRRRRS